VFLFSFYGTRFRLSKLNLFHIILVRNNNIKLSRSLSMIIIIWRSRKTQQYIIIIHGETALWLGKIRTLVHCRGGSKTTTYNAHLINVGIMIIQGVQDIYVTDISIVNYAVTFGDFSSVQYYFFDTLRPVKQWFGNWDYPYEYNRLISK